MLIRLLVALGCVAAVGGLNSAAAATIVYGDRASWAAAVPTANTVGFDGLLPVGATFDSFDSVAGLTVDGVNFVGPAPGISFCPTGYCLTVIEQGPFNLIPAGTYLAAPLRIVATMSTPVRAVAFDTWLGFLAAYPFPSTSPPKITLNNGDQTELVVSNELAFLGLVADRPSTQVDIRSEGTFLHIDNFATNSVPTVVPEPLTLLLVGVGLAARLGWKRAESGRCAHR